MLLDFGSLTPRSLSLSLSFSVSPFLCSRSRACGRSSGSVVFGQFSSRGSLITKNSSDKLSDNDFLFRAYPG